jgi:glycosyltransferase involved in cell wall biosynthesis
MHIAMIGQKGLGTGFSASRGAASVGGGIETHVLELSTRLVRLGHAVTAYGRSWYIPRGMTRMNGIRVVRTPSIRTKWFDTITSTLFATLHAAVVLRPEVYHFHGVGPALLSWIPRVVAPRATVVTTFHSVDRLHEKWGVFARFMLRLGERAAFAFADETIASSKTIVRYAEKEYGRRATYIPNGITPVRTSVDPLLLSPFGLQPFDYIAMVSRLVPHKGAHTLIAAWQRARAMQPDLLKNMKLAIIGGGAFTDEYVRKLQLMTSHDDSVVMTGHQRGETLDALFAGARFMVHPSTREGLPIAVLEEMSYGKAVIAANIPETMEVAAEYGVPFPAGDIEALAEAIVDLATDPMNAAAIGHAARTFVESEFHWDDLSQDVLDVYRRHSMIREGVFAVR